MIIFTEHYQEGNKINLSTIAIFEIKKLKKNDKKNIENNGTFANNFLCF